MRFIGDLHIHSKYSRATSKELDPVHLEYWAKIKGVNVVGTGDFTHPQWVDLLEETLVPAETGLYKLRDDLVLENKVNNGQEVRFLLSAEISNIYKKNGKVRKVHNVVLAPGFETVRKIQKELDRRKFNITSDGRPILGMDSRDLLEMLLEIDQNIFFIPAHIWTPWFAVLGSKSGFDSIEECFGDLTPYIYAVETGLSSDQPLNWLCSFLDRFNLVSNSDAHSPEKLGRNANIFNTELSYQAIIDAMKDQQSNALEATIDLYPQEGKYHYDGHRKCGVRFDPVQTLEHGGICPVCGKPLTLGVAHRIATLADRDDPLLRPDRKDFHYIIPLKEILSELVGTGPSSKKVNKAYFNLISQIGSEFHILLEADLQELKHKGGDLLAEAIRRMRQGEVIIEEGFDGQYGVIKLFDQGEVERFGSDFLFEKQQKTTYKGRPLLNFDVKRFLELKQQAKSATPARDNTQDSAKTLNEQQQEIIMHDNGNTLVLAGPGTGKTRVLTLRIVHLVKDLGVNPQNILAITFTRQAAQEMTKRLAGLLSGQDAGALTIGTFHAFALDLLKNLYGDSLQLINDDDKRHILKNLGVPKNKLSKYLAQISLVKNQLIDPGTLEPEIKQIHDKYQNYLAQNNLLDFDDLIYKTVKLLQEDSQLRKQLHERYSHILIDEFQDINKAQYELVKLLAGDKAKIFAIGDPNQAIYGFRGSSNTFIEEFKRDFHPDVFTLTTSYRVPQNILDASAGVLQGKQMLTGVKKGVKITISPQPTDKSEAEFIARQIEDMIGGLGFFSIDSNVTQGTDSSVESLSDFAILVRSRSQFPALEKALRDHNIPYQIVGTEPAYLQEPYSKIIDVFKYIANPQNNFAAEKIKDVKHVISHLDLNAPVHELLTSVAKILQIDTLPGSLVYLAKQHNNLPDFLLALQTASGQDDYNPGIESVTLMTLHASKGLEFGCVFIAGLEDGLIPYTIYRKDVDIEEERRLLYVGMTRAKEFLYLTYAQRRHLFNREWKLPPSRFLSDIKKELLQEKKQERKKKVNNQLKLF